MATTRLMPIHVSAGKSVLQSLKARMDYYRNGDKTEEGKLLSGYECDPKTAEEEFMLSKQEYHNSKWSIRKNEVIAYQIRQSFKPGEITPEKANELGYELAMRFTKGKYSFIVATHDDTKHIHNHIAFNSVSVDGKSKFKNFFNSSFTLQRLSDLICLENGLSVVEERKTRFQGKAKHKKKVLNIKDGKLEFVKDIENKILDGKGKGYVNWAKRFNAKQLSKTILFLQDKGISSFEELKTLTDEKNLKMGELKDLMKSKEKQLGENKKLQNAIIDFAKTKPVYDEYKKKKFSKSFYEEHEGELLLYKEAVAVFDESGYKKLPKLAQLRQDYGVILQEKKEAFSEYQQLQKDFKEYLIARKNLEIIYEKEEQEKDKSSKSKTSLLDQNL
ncbi:MAG: relaxase/mobilization nuclease domain-containing protein [Pseudobutyrivibrio sp.]|nr:relaxase/mobilization nuclease domain-containing protein [Pseudobutyrivibrio sp.]